MSVIWGIRHFRNVPNFNNLVKLRFVFLVKSLCLREGLKKIKSSIVLIHKAYLRACIKYQIPHLYKSCGDKFYNLLFSEIIGP